MPQESTGAIAIVFAATNTSAIEFAPPYPPLAHSAGVQTPEPHVLSFRRFPATPDRPAEFKLPQVIQEISLEWIAGIRRLPVERTWITDMPTSVYR